MRSISSARFCALSQRRLTQLLLMALFSAPAFATGVVTITSPKANSTNPSALTITASASGEPSDFDHLEVWDVAGTNSSYKLGNVPEGATSVNVVYVLPSGSHQLIVNAVANASDNWQVLNSANVTYTIAESCTDSTSVQCNFDQEPIDNTQNDCNPPQEAKWVANPCGSGIQGQGGTDPTSTNIAAITESGSIPDAGNDALDPQSLHLSEVQGSGGLSNVLFNAYSPTDASKTTEDTHWTLDEYVYLPNPQAHQAFEIDAQYVFGGVWTKFYTECAFNISDGTGYWGLYDSNTGGWIFLNGHEQGGQTPPTVACDRSQFALPLSGAGDSSFTGWHHIVWTFTLDPNTGTATYDTLTFDGTTTNVNFKPTTSPGGTGEGNNGAFSALVQLDGVSNPNGQYDTVDAYINELNITHTQ